MDSLTGSRDNDLFSFNSPSDGFSVSSNVAFSTDSASDSISDFGFGTDTIQLDNFFFGLSGTLVNGVNFFVITEAFDGTNSGASTSVSHIVVDSNQTVYHDSDTSVAGYTVVSKTQGDAPTIGDFSLT